MDPFFTSETKEQSKQWTSPGEPVPKTIKLAGKVMATVFLGCTQYNSYRLPSVEYTINGDYYAALLDRFNNILKKKHLYLAKKKMLFHQYNARVHMCPIPMAKFNEFRYELLLHPAYSPESPATISCFQTWRNGLEEREFHQKAHRRNRGLFWKVGQIIIRTAWKS